MPARVPARPSGADPRLPAGPFFATPEQRAALARERFFEEGVRPSGLVPEQVIQSWSRCVGAHRQPNEAIAFDPVTKARISTALARNRLLLEAARDDLSQLDAALAGTPVKAILTSHDGVIVHATPTANGEGRLMPVVARVGVDLGESTIGTGAPGVAARTGELCVVQGGEHFFDCINLMYCAAAPIRDARGDVAAVLDLSSEAEMFRFDAAAMVKLYATAIENRLLAAQARSQLLLRFQATPTLLHTPLEGLAAVQGDGRVAWFNGTGASLLGCERVPAWNAQAEALFGLEVEALLVLAHEGRARPQRLPSGLTLWMQAGFDARAPDAALPAPRPAEPPPPQAPAAATLRDANRSLIEETLAECKGNVSRAARRLGVSRGLLYRRMREWGLG
jgi:transcriptional regulator of acetoin/glycerol metabolism